MSVSSYRIMHMENIFPACFLSSRQLFITHSAVDVSSAGKLWHFAVVREVLVLDLGVRLYQHIGGSGEASWCTLTIFVTSTPIFLPSFCSIIFPPLTARS